MIKVAIIEDEKKTADTLSNIIMNISPNYQILGIADNIDDGFALINAQKPDIAFFDVELKDGLSFEILKQLPVVDFPVIFTTAYSHYAVRAFEYSAIDYIVKPVNPELIAKALLKAEHSLQRNTIQSKIEVLMSNLNAQEEKQKIVLQTAESNFYVQIDEIVRCEAENNYCNVILDCGEKIMVSKPLKKYEEHLPSNLFFRCHQSHLVNIKKIRQIKKRACKVIMENGDKVPLSARRKEMLITILRQV